jgi:hypothetical protein
MRTRIVAFVAALAVAGAAPVAQPWAASPSKNLAAAVVAHSCGSGYTHAVIGGEHKCLRRGQYCAKRYKRQYRRYGFTCARDARGDYRLK